MKEKTDETVITIRISHYGTQINPEKAFYKNSYIVREVEVDGKSVYSDRMTSEIYVKTNDSIRKLECFLLGLEKADRSENAASDCITELPYTLIDDPYYRPSCKFPEKYYWRMPLWKNREKVTAHTFLGWCMRVIEKVYLATRTEPTVLQTPPSLINQFVPQTPDDLVSMQIIIRSQPLACDVQEALRSYIKLRQMYSHQWSTRQSDKEIPSGYIAVLENYCGEKLISRQALRSLRVCPSRIQIVSDRIE